MFARGSAEIAELKIGADSPMKGIPLKELSNAIKAQNVQVATGQLGGLPALPGSFCHAQPPRPVVTLLGPTLLPAAITLPLVPSLPLPGLPGSSSLRSPLRTDVAWTLSSPQAGFASPEVPHFALLLP